MPQSQLYFEYWQKNFLFPTYQKSVKNSGDVKELKFVKFTMARQADIMGL